MLGGGRQSLTATAITFPCCRKHHPGILVSMASFWSLLMCGCVSIREGRLSWWSSEGKGYKRCCVCGIHMNNSSEGEPCLKTRTDFHSKGSIAFSATLGKRWPHPSLGFGAPANHTPAKPKAAPGWSSLAHEGPGMPQRDWGSSSSGTTLKEVPTRCPALPGSLPWMPPCLEASIYVACIKRKALTCYFKVKVDELKTVAQGGPCSFLCALKFHPYNAKVMSSLFNV